jgi:hypothetical protein
MSKTRLYCLHVLFVDGFVRYFLCTLSGCDYQSHAPCFRHFICGTYTHVRIVCIHIDICLGCVYIDMYMCVRFPMLNFTSMSLYVYICACISMGIYVHVRNYICVWYGVVYMYMCKACC